MGHYNRAAIVERMLLLGYRFGIRLKKGISPRSILPAWPVSQRPRMSPALVRETPPPFCKRPSIACSRRPAKASFTRCVRAAASRSSNGKRSPPGPGQRTSCPHLALFRTTALNHSWGRTLRISATPAAVRRAERVNAMPREMPRSRRAPKAQVTPAPVLMLTRFITP